MNRCRVTVYDLGGGVRIRDVWRKYYSEVALVFFTSQSCYLFRYYIISIVSILYLLYSPHFYNCNKKSPISIASYYHLSLFVHFALIIYVI